MVLQPSLSWLQHSWKKPNFPNNQRSPNYREHKQCIITKKKHAASYNGKTHNKITYQPIE